MNKKASLFFFPYFLIVVIILFGYATYRVYTKESAVIGVLYVGTNAKDINLLYNEFEAKSLFFEKALTMSYYDTIFYLYENGGKFNFDCGQQDGYVVWKVGDIDCFLDKKDFMDSFEKVVSSNMDIYSRTYLGVLLAGNLDLSYFEGGFSASTKTKISISRNNAVYTDKLSGRIYEQVPVDEFLQISTEARQYIGLCKEDISCYKSATLNSPFIWDVKSNGKLFMFDVNTNRRIGYFDKKDLILKFGVDFRELNPLFR